MTALASFDTSERCIQRYVCASGQTTKTHVAYLQADDGAAVRGFVVRPPESFRVGVEPSDPQGAYQLGLKAEQDAIDLGHVSAD